MTALCTLLILGATAAAQNIPVEDQLLAEEPVVRRYTVELIVFTYAEDVSVGSEIFVADDPVVAEDDLPADDSDPADDDASVDELEYRLPARRLEFVRLAEDDFTMTDIIRRLELLDAYEPIMHVAWRQPTYPREETAPIRLDALGAVPARLDGTFALYLSRYLHLVVDLELDAEDENAGALAAPGQQGFSFGDSRRQDDIYADPYQRAVRYHILENRIVKNGELRYFDHPKFGVIARVTRVEEDEEVEDDDESNDESRELLSSIRQ